ncbi:SMI1/KNR4 family protein [Flavobacterium quisquiliarum]|uniref:SMI1/KNR4 family protein n=1 Tax=Flavobacterium quisquiliarum TaxID=1834436 RepID=A0ABV8W274_9FLAO|nr:SMI1/KNR4 family protein [Flavobacterium quisquiliarum]MBW1655441.1 hypothetical protein [Flavobacterium quisquiliarum]NWL03065.1 hypothetical protein [Flavobacterium collinsii]
MKELYSIGEIKPFSKIQIEEIENKIPFSLPDDYKDFLNYYGLGSINELILIQEPDEEFIKNNFRDDMDIWTVAENETQLLLNSLTITTTIDGDIITVIQDENKPIVILPRHSEEPVYFESFMPMIEYYTEKYNLENLYFDPSFNFQQEYISFVKNGTIEKSLFDKVLEEFLKEISFDNSFNLKIQPKYIIQKIGGWVYFDCIGKSAIRVKYQEQFKTEAEKIIQFIKNRID